MRASKPSGSYGKAFLVKVWESRRDLTDSERYGFAQYFYLTICAHLESILEKIISDRLFKVEHVGIENIESTIRSVSDGVDLWISLEPIVDSIRSIVTRLKSDVLKAPLTKLTQLYAMIFPETLAKVVGVELNNDINALASLRNLYAHGRDVYMDFESNDELNFSGVLNKNPLQIPLQRLFDAGVIENINITGSNYIEYTNAFFQDDAMIYFYKKVQAAEKKIKDSAKDGLAFNLANITDLPELKI